MIRTDGDGRTDFQSDNDLGRSVASEFKHAAESAGRQFIPVYLTCDAEENSRRVSSRERQESNTTKLTDETVLQSIRSRSVLYRFSDCPGFELDVSHLLPTDAAIQICCHVQEYAEAAGTGLRLCNSSVRRVMGWAKNYMYDHIADTKLSGRKFEGCKHMVCSLTDRGEELQGLLMKLRYSCHSRTRAETPTRLFSHWS